MSIIKLKKVRSGLFNIVHDDEVLGTYTIGFGDDTLSVVYDRKRIAALIAAGAGTSETVDHLLNHYYGTGPEWRGMGYGTGY